MTLAKNTGKGYREGEVKDRSQVYNPKTETWTNPRACSRIQAYRQGRDAIETDRQIAPAS
jgi:hypothetical protein